MGPGAANGWQTAGMSERQVEIPTADGLMTTFIHTPDGDGPFPVVLYLMDAPSIRPALSEMAQRLADDGYYVMLPYLYYRSGPFKVWAQDDLAMHRSELMQTVSPSSIVGDAAALLAFAADDPAASDGPVGAVGFCMSGGLAIAAARTFPDRVKAAASIHGAWLVRDGDDSPHRGLDALDAELHFAWCHDDATAPVEDLAVMQDALAAAGVTYTLDFEEEAVHGFAPAGPRHHPEASARHWDRVRSLLDRRLRAGA